MELSRCLSEVPPGAGIVLVVRGVRVGCARGQKMWRMLSIVSDQMSLHVLTSAKCNGSVLFLLLWLLEKFLSNASNGFGHSLCALQVHEAFGDCVL
jgi:hypothetical protein